MGRSGTSMQDSIELEPFSNLAPEIQTELRALFQERTFGAGEPIFTQDQATNTIDLVAEGRVKTLDRRRLKILAGESGR